MAIRFDQGTMGSVEVTPQGGLRIPSNPTRSGVFPYRNADGSIRREYRPPDEVFRADSLASLRGAPVTDLHPHREGVPVVITPENWREYAMGHVGDDVRQDGEMVSAPVVILDQGMVQKVTDGTRRELSCGYSCDLDPTPGVTPAGENFDAIQKNIRYNHLAIGPEGWGRAGPTAQLRLDSGDGIQVQETTVEKEIIEGKEYTVGTPEHLAALRAQAQKEKGRADAAETKVKTVTTAAPDPKVVHAQAVVRSGLLFLCHRASAMKGVHFDAAAVEAVPNDGLAANLIGLIDPSFDVKGKSPDYLMGALETMIKGMVSEDKAEGETLDATKEPKVPVDPPPAMVKTDSIFTARAGTEAQKVTTKTDEIDRFDSEAASQDMAKNNAERWRKPLRMSAPKP